MNTPTMLRALPADHRRRLMRLPREVSFPQGTRLFDEGARADRFWILRTGSVELDTRVPGRRAAVIETLGANELVGWSWLFAPHVWHLGATAMTPVRAYEFDATAIRSMCQDDPALGQAVTQWVGEVLAHRLRFTRTRLLDLYNTPCGAGGVV
ncbi:MULTISPECIES: cyclic nucleotide-binding domain-containing protein [Streptomyces]|uniref:Cyclic nucleotide-binding domain-containing protein n=1 Tax=Streptomyces rhizosphaericus TaxID=114699 RepID=A0A6G4ADY3_9ACTN|nr:MULTISPECIES: cyclic nucleotide-binding domain-containing protein [Streptomyces]MBA6440787.1 cyclic nucleotide-binding domain-containing protein [Streptomyces sp. GMR22]NEW71626.1 cyclic nucleotide-binding domain-containing protein [Streptomyces rhizosphaericus]